MVEIRPVVTLESQADEAMTDRKSTAGAGRGGRQAASRSPGVGWEADARGRSDGWCAGRRAPWPLPFAGDPPASRLQRRDGAASLPGRAAGQVVRQPRPPARRRITHHASAANSRLPVPVAKRRSAELTGPGRPSGPWCGQVRPSGEGGVDPGRGGAGSGRLRRSPSPRATRSARRPRSVPRSVTSPPMTSETRRR